MFADVCAVLSSVTPRVTVNIVHVGAILIPDATFPRNAFEYEIIRRKYN